MKKLKVTLCIVLAFLLLLTGCNEEEALPKEEKELTPGEIVTLSIDERAALAGITTDELFNYTDMLWPYLMDGSLMTTWKNEEVPLYENAADDIVITSFKKEGDILDFTLLIGGRSFIDPDTGEESPFDGIAPMAEDEEGSYCVHLPLGEAHFIMRDEGEAIVHVSNEYTPFPEPAKTYLMTKNEEFREEIEASPKLSEKFPDMTDWMKRAVYMSAAGLRYIESPEDLTLFDLENITDFSLSYPNIISADSTEYISEDYLFDAEPISYMKNLKYFETYFGLDDYSVFKELDLYNLSIDLSNSYGSSKPLPLDTLEVGKADYLSISNFYEDMPIDLKGANVGTLSVMSWANAITDFKGCENVTSLEVRSTRSDMTLVNRDNFPSADYIHFDIYSDNRRIRDFSKLATFPEDTNISLILGYRAANDDTLKSLEGVRLDYLEIRPEDGPYPLPNEPDPKIVEKINIDENNIYWETL